jgi:hypothetical protein
MNRVGYSRYVEGVVFHVGNFVLDIFAGLFVVVDAGDSVGIDHKRPFLAFTDMRVELGSLAVVAISTTMMRPLQPTSNGGIGTTSSALKYR